MGIEIIPIGGYSKIEGNSVAVKVDDDVVILDLGLTMDNFVEYQNRNSNNSINYKTPKLNYSKLRKVDAVPDIFKITDLFSKVKAVIPSHAHLDHVGAVTYAMKYFKNTPVVGTPFTIGYLKKHIRDEEYSKKFKSNNNPLITVKLNSKYIVSEKITVEFIHVTHSIPDSAILAIHTPYGIVLYAVDYKFDDFPQVGKPPNYKRLEVLGKQGIKCLILESLYADYDIETPSEKDVKRLLINTLNELNIVGRNIFLSTFSSHLARLKTLIETGVSLNRKVYLVGRSLKMYTSIAEKLKIVDFKEKCTVLTKKQEIEGLLINASRNKGDYFIICTGHQGEPFSVLSRIADRVFSKTFNNKDIVLFSSSVIPTKTNEESFKILENKLTELKVEIIKNIHASGHAGLKDHEKMLKLVNPEYVIPAHAGIEKTKYLKELCERLKIGKAILVSNGDRIHLE